MQLRQRGTHIQVVTGADLESLTALDCAYLDIGYSPQIISFLMIFSMSAELAP